MTVYKSVASSGHKEKFKATRAAHYMFIHSQLNSQEQKEEAEEKNDRRKSVKSSHHLSENRTIKSLARY